MQIRYYIVLLHFVVLISCGGTAENKSAAESATAESEERVKQCNHTIAQLEHKNEIILLACRLQEG